MYLTRLQFLNFIIVKITEFDAAEINQLLNSIRNFDSSIGSYEQHSILPDDGTYSIKLTNGSIRIYVEELADKQSLLRDRLKDIAARFREKK
jgi:hypothetical protein